mmetsp:Transcript_37815/g.117921  ORF Transcript_37815/g.117921 Transcript_37815/m.117921 type:complete len:201 (+) Transcript_37815:918-1520(+)
MPIRLVVAHHLVVAQMLPLELIVRADVEAVLYLARYWASNILRAKEYIRRPAQRHVQWLVDVVQKRSPRPIVNVRPLVQIKPGHFEIACVLVIHHPIVPDLTVRCEVGRYPPGQLRSPRPPSSQPADATAASALPLPLLVVLLPPLREDFVRVLLVVTAVLLVVAAHDVPYDRGARLRDVRGGDKLGRGRGRGRGPRHLV